MKTYVIDDKRSLLSSIFDASWRIGATVVVSSAITIFGGGIISYIWLKDKAASAKKAIKRYWLATWKEGEML